jgi:hypothetical protein
VPSDTASSFTAARPTYTQFKLFLDKAQLLPPTAQFQSIRSAGATKSYHNNLKWCARGLEWQFFRPRFRPQTYFKSNPIFVKQTRKFVQRVVRDVESLHRLVYLIRSEEVNPALLQKVEISEM